eukprot:3868090-Ditylum_brightwellii.AAC.1
MAQFYDKSMDIAFFMSNTNMEYILVMVVIKPKLATSWFVICTYQDALKQQLNHSKMEVRHFDGSNGLPQTYYDFLKFLYTPGTLAWKTIGCRFQKDNRIWNTHYKSPK